MGPEMWTRRRARKRFRRLFEAELGYVCRSLRRLGVAERDVEDQAQEVFVRVYERLEEVDDRGPTRAWLFAFALRIASNYRQLRRHERECMPGDMPQHPTGDDPHESMERARTRARILAALEDLPLERRAVFVLHELDQIAAPAIGEALGIPTNTVYSRLRRGREEFRAAYSALAEEVAEDSAGRPALVSGANA